MVRAPFWWLQFLRNILDESDYLTSLVGLC